MSERDDESGKKSVWERDLLDNRVGRFLGQYVFPLLAFAVGTGMAVFVLRHFSMDRLADCTLLATSLMFFSYGCMWVAAKTFRPTTPAGLHIQERAVRISLYASMLFLALTLLLRFADGVVHPSDEPVSRP